MHYTIEEIVTVAFRVPASVQNRDEQPGLREQRQRRRNPVWRQSRNLADRSHPAADAVEEDVSDAVDADNTDDDDVADAGGDDVIEVVVASAVVSLGDKLRPEQPHLRLRLHQVLKQDDGKSRVSN